MRKLNVMIVVGLIIAVLGAGIVVAYGRNVDNRIADGQQTVDVLVAKKSIQAGASADTLASVVTTKAVPRHYLVVSPLTSLSDVSGKFLQTGVPANGQLSSLMFGTQAAATQAVSPSKGNVALAIQVGLTPGVAKYVAPGSTVDMFVTYQSVANDVSASGNVQVTSPTTAKIDFTAKGSLAQQTKLFVSGVKVLSVTPATPATSSGTEDQSTVSPGDSVIAVLDVRPMLAQKIVNASTFGSLYLGLDAPGEVHRTNTGATPRQVVHSSDVVRPTP